MTTKNNPAHAPRSATEIDKAIGLRIKKRRIQLGLSQSDLGAPLGVSFQQVQKYERGTNRVSASRLFEMAETLNVTPDYFYEGLASGGGDNSQTKFDKFYSSGEAIVHMKAIYCLPKAIRRALLELSRSLGSEE